MAERRALMAEHPRRVDVPLMLLVAAGLLIAGLTLPTLRMTKVIFFTDTYSIWGGVVELWQSDHPILAAIIFFFSLVFPLVKLATLAAVWTLPLRPTARLRVVHHLGVLGKWSMLDVYVVATIVVLIKAQDLADANAGWGIYLFAGAILLSMLATQVVVGLCRASGEAD